MESSQNSDRVDSYLKGNMSESEKAAFQKELLDNESLQLELHKTQVLYALLTEKRLLDLKNLAKEHYEADQRRGKSYKYLIGLFMAAGMVGTAWAAWYRTEPSQSIPDKEIHNITVPLPQSSPKLPKNPELLVDTLPKSNKPTATVHPIAPQQVAAISSPEDTIHNTEVQSINVKTEHTALKEQPTKDLPAIEPCAHAVLHADIHTYPTCLDQEKGAVSLSNMGGGTAPYSFEVLNKAGETVLPTQLAAGTYSVVLKDVHHCHKRYDHIEIKTKMCPQNYAFNPYAGEVWHIPSYKYAGMLRVVDKAGNTYLSKEIPAHSQETWDGNSPLGDLKIGYYLYSINYTDGTELRGAVTLLK